MKEDSTNGLDLAQGVARPRQSLFVARGFLFFGQFVVPLVVGQAKLCCGRFGFANTDLAAFVQVFLNKSIIGCGFGDMFHAESVAEVGNSGNGGFTGPLCRSRQLAL